MKKLLFAIATVVLLASCYHDEPDYVDLDKYASLATKSGFTVTRELDTDISDTQGINTYDICGTETKATYASLNSAIAGILSTVTSKMIHQVVGTYTSSDINGNPITVSGKIFYPKGRPIKNMMIVSHYTIGSNAESPSESFSFEGIYAALGYAVVVADYIGFGHTVSQIHPYLQARVTACNVIDMALVARPFLKERGLAPESDEVILLGYSQGGATTLHVQRLLETDPEYMGQFKIKKNYAGAGPYNIAKTYDFSVSQDVTGIPSAIPMIIQGMSIGMDVPLDMSYFFREPLRSNYSDWINSKKYTVSQMSELIGSNRLSMILTSNATDRSKKETGRFYAELQRNSIPVTYVPEAPLFMFHSEDDQTVPFVNSQLMQRQFRIVCPDVEYDFGHYGNHQQGALKFILKVFTMLD